MNRRSRFSLLAWGLFIVGVAAWADARPPGSPVAKAGAGGDQEKRAGARPGDDERRAGEDLQRHWEDARRFLRQGAYEDARRALAAILAVTPADPWAQLYHSLCERRLQSSRPFTQLSPSQFRSLQQELQQEEQAQRRAAARQKAMERTVRKEQDRWDRQLEAGERQAKREEERKQREARVRAAAPHRVEAAAEPHEEIIAPESEQPPEPSLPTSPSPEGAVELELVVVPTLPAESEEGISPSLVGRTLPAQGAVAINARQMSVSPDRKIAIADGDVEVIFENMVLTCDHLTLFTDTKDAYAEGRVRIEEGNQLFRGELAHYNFEAKKGRFLQGTVSSPPWHEHGRTVEHIAEGVYEVTPGYLTTCELEPPHFRLAGRRAIVFANDRLARMRNVALLVEQMPFLYLPYLAFADRQSPFFIIPGKKKPWEQFALMGYRYELPGRANQKGTVKLDWRRTFGWGTGLDHHFDDPRLGKGLLKVYYNEEPNQRRPESDHPKGAGGDRYRVLWRHQWQPDPNTSVVTDIQKFSDVQFRRELLFRDEFITDDIPESFVSFVRNDPDFSLSANVRQRMNRFQTVTEAFPDVAFDVREQRIGDTQFFSRSQLGFANLQTKNTHSESDTDVVRLDWLQQLKYGLDLFRPILITPRTSIRQTYYTKDKQGGSERPHGKRDVISGQVSMGADASLKLFRVFPVVSNALGLNINRLRHVLTPTISHSYTHRPTVPNDLLNFATAGGHGNSISFGLENKLQTRRLTSNDKLVGADLGRFLITLPYSFHDSGNEQGGRFGDWSFDVELTPWPWFRLESDWSYPSHFLEGSRDSRVTAWNLDVTVSGRPRRAGPPRPTPRPTVSGELPVPLRIEETRASEDPAYFMPVGEWNFGMGHRYSYNDKTEGVFQFNWRLSEKWQINSFHRFTWKEVVDSSKRFNNMREYQYTLTRDLHDWVGRLVYHVDREFGEELLLTLTLKAYPNLPIELETSYHQPKFGSQSDPFSPVRGQ